MKRFTAGVVAVATALSLSTGVAAADSSITAPDKNAKNGSSNDNYTNTYIFGAVLGEFFGGDAVTSSVKNLQKDSDAKTPEDSPLFSSFKSDAANGWKLGTTFDILWGTGVAALILAALAGAAQSGQIPGLNLPR